MIPGGLLHFIAYTSPGGYRTTPVYTPVVLTRKDARKRFHRWLNSLDFTGSVNQRWYEYGGTTHHG